MPFYVNKYLQDNFYWILDNPLYGYTLVGYLGPLQVFAIINFLLCLSINLAYVYESEDDIKFYLFSNSLFYI